ncbi:MAG: SH3 domain-containing protein [Caldilineaceae bacterium]
MGGASVAADRGRGDYNSDWALMVADTTPATISRPRRPLCAGAPPNAGDHPMQRVAMQIQQRARFCSIGGRGPIPGGATSTIVALPGDFPDDQTTSDHRTVLARFWPDQAVVAAPTPAARPSATAATTGPTANRNANLRSGPGTGYTVAGSVQQGEALRITGRSSAGDWVQLDNGAWIAAFLVSGAPAGLSVVAAPALPTPVPPPATAVPASPTATPTPVQPVAPPQPVANCDPSYPTVCIPPYPPDLDCGEIPYRRFAVVGADPHRFDGDHDGIGCER